MMVADEQGQSLLEVTIMLGMVVVIITAVTITTVVGIKNSQFSKNQLQATKLAQEGIEKVRIIRDRDFTICTNASDLSTCQLWSVRWGVGFGNKPGCFTSNTCRFAIVANNAPFSNCSVAINQTILYCLIVTGVGETVAGNFNRQIFIEDDQNNQKKITATVSWTDYSGKHQSDLTTILAKQ